LPSRAARIFLVLAPLSIAIGIALTSLVPEHSGNRGC